MRFCLLGFGGLRGIANLLRLGALRLTQGAGFFFGARLGRCYRSLGENCAVLLAGISDCVADRRLGACGVGCGFLDGGGCPLFDGSADDDIANYTNRSPYPTLHLLREDSVSRAVDAYPDPDSIIERNYATLRELGHAGWKALFPPRDAG